MQQSASSGGRQLIIIMLALAIGIVVGVGCNYFFPDPLHGVGGNVVDFFLLLSEIFLRMIKMIISPLVFTTLTVGIARQGSGKDIGRIGGKTLLWFVSGSFVSLFLGMLLVNFFKPGAGLNLINPATAATAIASPLTLHEFITHIFPVSIFEAMAKNEVLQVVVFSLFFGVALASVGEKGRTVINGLDATAHVILKITTYVMKFAPIAVLGAMVGVIARQGIHVLYTYSRFIVEFYAGLFLLLLLLFSAAWYFIRRDVYRLIKHIREPALIAFSTNSSEAAFPKLMLELERFGCDEKLVSFVLPLGYSFNLAGSMMYMTFASLFLAQAYNITLSYGTQLSMLLVLMLTSKGIAGVPRASLVVVAGTLASYKIPDAGMALLIGIDPILDMGRASVNVIGNSVATAVVSSWERPASEVKK